MVDVIRAAALRVMLLGPPHRKLDWLLGERKWLRSTRCRVWTYRRGGGNRKMGLCAVKWRGSGSGSREMGMCAVKSCCRLQTRLNDIDLKTGVSRKTKTRKTKNATQKKCNEENRRRFTSAKFLAKSSAF